MDKSNVASSIGALVGTQSTAAQVMARYRATANEYGRFFGEQIYTVVATNPDLKWKEDVLNDKNTLRKEVNVFKMCIRDRYSEVCPLPPYRQSIRGTKMPDISNDMMKAFTERYISCLLYTSRCV